MNKGKSAISCKFENDTYVPGDVARAQAVVNNTGCSMAVKSIDIALKLRRETRADVPLPHKTMVVVKKSFAGCMASEQKELTLDLPLHNNSFCWTKKQSLVQKYNTDKMQSRIDPLIVAMCEKIQPGTEGKMLKFKYFLEVSVNHANPLSCGGAIPKGSMLVQMCAADLKPEQVGNAQIENFTP